MLRFIDGFDQFQGQADAALLTSLTSAGYVTSVGLAMAPGRHAGTHALELQVTAGAAGVSWSRRQTTSKLALRAVANNAVSGRWIAVGDNGSMVTSLDSITWSPVVSGMLSNLRGIAYNGSIWIAVGASGVILSSPDGQNWTQRVCPIPTATLNAVAYGNGKWVIAGANGYGGAILVSDDGLSWSAITINPGAKVNNCIAYGDTMWIAAGVGGQVLTSPDAITWTTRVFSATTSITALAFGMGTWLVGTGSNIHRSLNAGASWALAAADILYNVTLTGLAFTDGRWVAVGQGYYSNLATSDDAMTWVARTLSGAGDTPIYAVAVSTAAQSAWIAVGAVVGATTSSTAFIYVSAAPPTTFKRTFTSDKTRVVLGFAHKANARGRILSIDGLLNMDWPSGIEILGTLGPSVPIRNAWYYYELTIDKTAKTISLHVNDTADVTVPLPVAGETMTSYAVTWMTENGAIAQIDDVYFLDNNSTGGSTITERLKPIRIPLRLPTEDVELQWDGSATGAHWPLVGLLPPSPLSFIRSNTSGAKDLFRSNVALPVGAGSPDMPIIAVGVIALAQKSDLDNRQLGLVVGEGAGQLEIVDTTLSMAAEYSTAIFEKAPGNVAWDAVAVVGSAFGVVVRP